ncbi:hypothetical protein GT030_29630 [Streptomyces sp. SID1328]|uniref:hypothetical protein n=1 Tax=Streptomyces sp. SID1328 TaxID=2690250 RepID=UPI0013714E74|nr:hypothetical protein [Streptomyces sp. SID1328]MYV42915.1 hypothetical protein [Streptomyces sp. SID1328]
MNRHLGMRLARLENQMGTGPDLAGETERYGAPLWSATGTRAYGQDTPDGAQLAIVSPHGSVVYEVAGVSLGDLS